MKTEAFELVLFERVDQSLMLVAGEPATDDVPVFFAIMPAANDEDPAGIGMPISSK
jgi:hypothetical protein